MLNSTAIIPEIKTFIVFTVMALIFSINAKSNNYIGNYRNFVSPDCQCSFSILVMRQWCSQDHNWQGQGQDLSVQGQGLGYQDQEQDLG